MAQIRQGESDVLDAVQMPGRHQVHVDRSARRAADRFRPGDAGRPLPDAGRGATRTCSPASRRYYGDDAGACAAHLRLHVSSCGSCRRRRCCRTAAPQRGLPISCFLNEASDSLEGIVGLWNENVWLASKGGGIGSLLGQSALDRREGGRGRQDLGRDPVHPGDGQPDAWRSRRARCGAARRRSICRSSHPEIEEFVEIRRPTGGDPNRKALNLHHGILVSGRVHARGGGGRAVAAAVAQGRDVGAHRSRRARCGSAS